MLSLADANFGIFPDRDLEIAQWAIKIKQEYTVTDEFGIPVIIFLLF